MSLSIYALKVAALAETLHRWLAVLMGLDSSNRERIAGYAEAIAATLARAAAAIIKLEAAPGDVQTRNEAIRELGRMTGYVETIVAVLEHHLDGRKIAGVKRRLDQLDVERLALALALEAPRKPGEGLCKGQSARLAAAEGYFRALADGLRA
jgi:hypothetical protein